MSAGGDGENEMLCAHAACCFVSAASPLCLVLTPCCKVLVVLSCFVAGGLHCFGLMLLINK